MCAMNHRLLRPTLSSFHPETLGWHARVIANGGSVSVSTMRAVSQFCASINAESGLRAAILRCNLFCGNSDASLYAVRTPLYLSGSPSGAVIGNTTDTNVNFAQADYQETGSEGGLKGNGASKYLDTGFNGSTSIPSSVSAHLSYSGTLLETSGNAVALGSFHAAGGALNIGGLIADVHSNYGAGSAIGRPSRIGSVLNGQFPIKVLPESTQSHFLGTRTGTTAGSLYLDGALVQTNAFSQTPQFYNGNILIFALNNAGAASTYSAARLRMYSIGNGLTAAQALAFYNAVRAFNTALGRT